MDTGTKTFISHYHFVARVHVFQIADTSCCGSKSPNKYALHYLKVLYYASCYYAITMFHAVCRLEIFFFFSFAAELSNRCPISPVPKSCPRLSNFKQTDYFCCAHWRTCARAPHIIRYILIEMPKSKVFNSPHKIARAILLY